MAFHCNTGLLPAMGRTSNSTIPRARLARKKGDPVTSGPIIEVREPTACARRLLPQNFMLWSQIGDSKWEILVYPSGADLNRLLPQSSGIIVQRDLMRKRAVQGWLDPSISSMHRGRA